MASNEQQQQGFGAQAGSAIDAGREYYIADGQQRLDDNTQATSGYAEQGNAGGYSAEGGRNGQQDARYPGASQYDNEGRLPEQRNEPGRFNEDSVQQNIDAPYGGSNQSQSQSQPFADERQYGAGSDIKYADAPSSGNQQRDDYGSSQQRDDYPSNQQYGDVANRGDEHGKQSHATTAGPGEKDGSNLKTVTAAEADQYEQKSGHPVERVPTPNGPRDDAGRFDDEDLGPKDIPGQTSSGAGQKPNDSELSEKNPAGASSGTGANADHDDVVKSEPAAQPSPGTNGANAKTEPKQSTPEKKEKTCFCF